MTRFSPARAALAGALTVALSAGLTPHAAGAKAKPMFTGPTDTLVARHPSGLAAADFNHDGRTDLVTSPGREQGARTQLRLSEGTGAFRSKELPLAGTAVVAADVDNDGNADVVAVDSMPGAEGSSPRPGIAVLLGDGRGAFSKPVHYPIAGSSSDLIGADLNGDGILDLAVTHDSAGDVGTYLGDGRGAFRFSGRFVTEARSLVASDLNADGAAELVVVYGQFVTRVAVARNDGTGRLTLGKPLRGLPHGDHKIAVGDTNADGRPDVVVAGKDGLAVLRGKKGGGLGAATRIAGTCPSSKVRDACAAGALDLADVDGDERLDIVVTHPHVTDVTVLTAKGRSYRAAAKLRLPAMHDPGYGSRVEPGFVLLRDLNADCATDPVVSTRTTVSTYLNARQVACPR